MGKCTDAVSVRGLTKAKRAWVDTCDMNAIKSRSSNVNCVPRDLHRKTMREYTCILHIQKICKLRFVSFKYNIVFR